jgi:hypothetical protein
MAVSTPLVHPGTTRRRTSPVIPSSTRNDHLPVYESLVRERGDVVEEARVAAEQTQRQMAEALNGHEGVQPEQGPR